MIHAFKIGRRFQWASLTSCFLLLIFLSLNSCGNKPKIAGEVVDGFGNPLRDAVVSVEGTTFKATTNSNGKYSVGYVPGKISVMIRKEGYTSANLPFDIAIESAVPAETVTLYKIPEGKGVFFFGQSDYVPLTRGKISFTSKKFPFSWDKPLSEDTYTAIGKFTPIEKGKPLKFLDNDGGNQQLFSLSQDGVILARTKSFTNTRDKSQILHEETREIEKGIFLREISLDTGKYAFVTIGAASQSGLGGIGSGGPAFGFLGHPISEPVYLFEVK